MKLEIHYNWSHGSGGTVRINSRTATPTNIKEFGLVQRFEHPVADIYSKSSRSKILIVNIKKPKEFGSKRTFPHVDWFEDNINDLKNRLNNIQK